jgi:hypothetical protein
MRRRTEAAVVREDLAITRFAAGVKLTEICNEMRMTFGGQFSGGTVRGIIRRGIARRLANNPEGFEEAVGLIQEGYRQILAAHMPYAIGDLGDGPDVRRAEVAMKALDKIGELWGARRIPDITPGGVNVTVNVNEPGGIDAARDQILTSLHSEAEKMRIVDGALASVGTSQHALTSGEPEDDTLGPPPGVIPTQEEAA